jgi:hypothetical protein
MLYEDGRVTILPKQICRLAELSSESSNAVEIKQYGSVLIFNNGQTKLRVNADGNIVPLPNQENLW